ncbi:hypothetical protein A2X44_01080 [candidate division CPR3 bacterium GWF2_35_18]|uniref:Uncharacterized protein n=1 Tax=candidate division CPR3 bacterium GW2011_GWF2_35_18 TaxID=1618350 RepID=A0A0G0E4M4_UNCC3|nr:MAG: hypothetical protein UR67_C0001G0194 [candidate division CPR3 bacterium GW2011_GWF2_35_18]KKP85397.1 MAG: hypothetical protein UR87_C0052G0006 [candidate division CPR3 bacterium GW2011_GWE2_35_7]OGB63495.1 MAG: hypothetical protein A2X44_01080 [candidate division CPR3 bacterium GWF2_35_18]OGB64760.1 MAG: hypothetical protein A2250_04945 [candidate division CPR3 bacterium RIFOXYA2_FULL_35_13]OGB77292.1 MAG: hypothetical protein A2476_03975 [candidate division CPR3 bacterium RIFOXYC2_FULL
MDKKTKTALYEELMQAIIDKQKEILGIQVAVERAKKIDELWVSIDGKILQINGEHEAVLQSLLNEYFKLTTQAGLEACLSVIKEHLKKNEKLELPEEVSVLLKDQ